MTRFAREVNFDGLVGPTHNYAGLSFGNIASQSHGSLASNPKKAALEGLAKMKMLADLGVAQAVIPPHFRPDIATLRRLGFQGSDAAVLERVQRESPDLLASVSSASSMWVANAATVSPSADTADGRVHITPANLISQPHRGLESNATAVILKTIFEGEDRFAHHEPLPAGSFLGDEGAANHTRFCREYHEGGIELFVYGKSGFQDKRSPSPGRYPARQTREASESVARLHGLPSEKTVFAQQNPDAIDAGVFHNDVIAVGNRNVMLYHHEAYVDTARVIDEIKRKYELYCDDRLTCIGIGSDQVSLKEAVGTYFFNSQIVCRQDGGMVLVCPAGCRENSAVQGVIEEIIGSDCPIDSVCYVDVLQSMNNGGGPACLRLRVVLTEAEKESVRQGVFMTSDLYTKLTRWIGDHYRDRLTPNDLAAPELLDESRCALDELAGVLGLGSIYPFQQA